MRSFSIVLLVCFVEVLTMIGTFTYPAMLPEFIEIWSLTNTGAGWIAGIFLAGFAGSVPILMALTDRIDARRVHLFGSFVATVSLLLFAFTAEGFWSALIYRALAGVGLAATYMPGLKMLVDRYDGNKESRAVAFYTASFSLGTAASFFISGEIGAAFGWETAYWVAALCAAAAFIVVFFVLKPVTPEEPEEHVALFDFRPVLRNRAALGFIIGYGIHNWELFALRSWLVAFLVFVLSQQSGQSWWPAPTVIATLSALVAVLASIGGNELAEKYDRRRMIAIYMMLSGGVGLVAGFLGGGPYWMVVLVMLVYAAFIQLDSAAYTAGVISVATEGRRGATLGLHSLVGFGGAAIGPLAVGLVLDLSGGAGSTTAWGLGFASVGLVSFIGIGVFRALRPKAHS